jgi:hypothetical protein
MSGKVATRLVAKASVGRGPCGCGNERRSDHPGTTVDGILCSCPVLQFMMFWLSAFSAAFGVGFVALHAAMYPALHSAACFTSEARQTAAPTACSGGGKSTGVLLSQGVVPRAFNCLRGEIRYRVGDRWWSNSRRARRCRSQMPICTR